MHLKILPAKWWTFCLGGDELSKYEPLGELWAVDCESSQAPSWWRHQMETFSALLALCTGIHQSPYRIHQLLVNSLHNSQWHGALMFSLICAWINGWVNNGETGDLRCHHTHYDVTVMLWCSSVDNTNAVMKSLNRDHTLNTRKAPHTSPLWASKLVCPFQVSLRILTLV